MTDEFPSLAIGSIAFSPLDASNNTLYAGTGSFSSLGSSGGLAIGVLRTTDGGATWSNFPLNPGGGDARIRTILPTSIDTDPGVGVQQLVLAGTVSGGGLFRSNDNGQNWTPISGLNNLPTGDVSHIIVDPTNANRFYAAVSNDGVFRGDYDPSDGSLDWTDVNNDGLAGVVGAAGNIQLAMQNDGDIFALVSGSGTSDGAAPNNSSFFRSTNDGDDWTMLAQPADLFERGVTARAANTMEADPTVDDVVYITTYGGGDDIFRYDPVGNAWVLITQGGAQGGTAPHADGRDLAFLGNDILLDANDGGFYFLENPTDAVNNSWQTFNGGPTGGLGLGNVEAHNIAWDNRFNVSFIGMQDNGTAVQDGTGNRVWDHFNGGDGADVAVDSDTLAAANRSIRYLATQNFQASFSRNVFDSATNIVEDVALIPAGGLAGFVDQFTTPFEVNAIAPTAAQLLAGESRRIVIGGGGAGAVYEANNAGTAANAAAVNWVQVLPAAGVGSVNCMAYGGRRLGVDNPEVLYVGSGSQIFLRSTAGGTLTAVTTPLAGGTIRDIVMDPEDWQHVFVISNNRVFESTNAGTGWTERTGNLADPQLLSLEFIPTAGGVLLAGGNYGVFRMRLTNPAVWTEFGAGLPNANVNDMDYHAGDDVLVVATFGRGAWKVNDAADFAALPTALNVCGDDAIPIQDDTFRLVRNAANPLLLDVYVNNVLQFSGPIAGIEQINVFGAGGNDTLIVDSSNALINVFNGIRYDGDNACPGQIGAGFGGFDRLDLVQTGGSATGVSDTLAIGATNGSGRSTIVSGANTQTVDFINLEPVTDNVAAATFSITSAAGLASLLQTGNIITYQSGLLLAGSARVVVDTFEPIEFLNKTALTIDAGAGADVVDLIHTATPAGLTGITVNAGSGDDTVIAAAGAVTPGLVVNGGLGNDNLSANGNLNGEGGNDVLIGGASGNTLNGGDGEDILDGRGGSNTLNGGANTDTILVSGTAGPDTMTTTHGAGTFNITGGLSAGSNTISGIEAVRVEAGDGADAITLNLLAAGGLHYTVLGGNPIGTPLGDSLTVNSAAAMTVTPGPENDAGSVDADTTTPTNVSFDEIEVLIIGGGGGGVINGTNGNDAITIIARDDSYNAAADGVQDFTAVVNAGLEILFLNQPTLTVNALGGSDTIVVRTPAPNNAVWNVDVTVDGGAPSAGDPSGSDRLVVETPGGAAETATYTPTAADAGTLDLTSLSSLLTISQIEELLYDGEADNDSLTVAATGGDDVITHTPGTTDQAGAFQVNGLLPIAYQNLGAGGSLTADGAGGADTLVYFGTNANDTFQVPNAAGNVALNSRLVVTTTSVETLTMEGLLGDDLFDLVPVITSLVYGRVNANGGGEASATGDRTSVRTTGTGDAIGISGQVITVGGKVVASSGVEAISLNAAAGIDVVTYNGVAGTAEAINFISSGVKGQGQISVPGVTLVTFTGVERLVANGNTGVDGDEDTFTFTGTNAVDRFLINLAAAGTAADPVLRLQNAAGTSTLLTLFNYTNFNTLNVKSLDGNDVINVYTSATGPSRNLFVDGGAPTGKRKETDKLTVFYTPPRPRIIHSTATQNPDAGLVDLDYDTARFLVQYNDVEDVVIKRL